MSDTEAWGPILAAGHWNHGGWTVDSREGVLMCACGEEVRDEQAAAS